MAARFLLTLAFVGGISASAQACDATFSTDLNPARVYPSSQISEFVKNEFRPQLGNKLTAGKFKVLMVSRCPEDIPQTQGATLTVLPGNYYIVELNGIPLKCGGAGGANGACGSRTYNYVSYKPGPLRLSKAEIDLQVRSASAFKTINKFAGPANGADSTQLHNIVKTFALILAEAARFDEVHGAVARMDQGCALQFEHFWPIVHNWGTISHTVQRYQADFPIPTGTFIGDGGLLAPVTSEMREFFNKELQRHPAEHHAVPATGKDLPVGEIPTICA